MITTIKTKEPIPPQTDQRNDFSLIKREKPVRQLNLREWSLLKNDTSDGLPLQD